MRWTQRAPSRRARVEMAFLTAQSASPSARPNQRHHVGCGGPTFDSRKNMGRPCIEGCSFLDGPIVALLDSRAAGAAAADIGRSRGCSRGGRRHCPRSPYCYRQRASGSTGADHQSPTGERRDEYAGHRHGAERAKRPDTDWARGVAGSASAAGAGAAVTAGGGYLGVGSSPTLTRP
jgi:hypothetical protein